MHNKKIATVTKHLDLKSGNRGNHLFVSIQIKMENENEKFFNSA